MSHSPLISSTPAPAADRAYPVAVAVELVEHNLRCLPEKVIPLARRICKTRKNIVQRCRMPRVMQR